LIEPDSSFYTKKIILQDKSVRGTLPHDFLGSSGILIPEKRLMFFVSNFLSGKCGVALASRSDPFADWLAGNLPEFRPAVWRGFSSGLPRQPARDGCPAAPGNAQHHTSPTKI